MKITCSQNDLSSKLSTVSRIVPSRPTHPVLGNILLIANEERQEISLTGFDLNISINTTFSAQVKTEGEITLPAKLFNEMVNRLPSGDVTIDDEKSQEESIIITITSSSGSYQIRTIAATEYPDLPIIDSGTIIQLPCSALSEGLKGCLFACSPDETKQVLTGVYLNLTEDTLEFAATDGHRLAVVQTIPQSEEEESHNSSKDFSITIPARALRELEKILTSHLNSNVTLAFDDRQISFEFGTQRLTSRKLEGQYPNYNSLIPHDFSHQVTVDRKQLISSLERIAVLVDQKSNTIKFSLVPDQQQIILSVDTADVGSGKESLPATISSDGLDLGFNIKYLLESLKVIPTQEVQLQMKLPNSPVIITPLGGTKMTHLVMPLQVH